MDRLVCSKRTVSAALGALVADQQVLAEIESREYSLISSLKPITPVGCCHNSETSPSSILRNSPRYINSDLRTWRAVEAETCESVICTCVCAVRPRSRCNQCRSGRRGRWRCAPEFLAVDVDRWTRICRRFGLRQATRGTQYKGIGHRRETVITTRLREENENTSG